MKANEVLSILNISRVTLCTYVKEGLIRVSKKKTGQYEYDEQSVYEFLGLKYKKKDKVNLSYSRVSSQSQKDELKDQTQRIYDSCISKGIQLDEQIEDVKSGIDSSRKGFQRLIERVIKGEVGLIVVENKDRLTRFNFDLLELIFKYYGTQIIVLNNSLENRTYEQELTEDLISIIHYFTMKSYSHRRKLNKIRKELEDERKSNNLEN